MRGAPAIGIAAAYGYALAAARGEDLEQAAATLAAARPTAVNLVWALREVAAADDPAERAREIHREEVERCRQMALHAAALLELNAYHRQFNLWETVPDDVLPALAALRARGLRLVVVSNANGTLLSMFTRLGLVSAFDVIFDSHVVGIEKPDPRFFRQAMRYVYNMRDPTMGKEGESSLEDFHKFMVRAAFQQFRHQGWAVSR